MRWCSTVPRAPHSRARLRLALDYVRISLRRRKLPSYFRLSDFLGTGEEESDIQGEQDINTPGRIGHYGHM